MTNSSITQHNYRLPILIEFNDNNKEFIELIITNVLLSCNCSKIFNIVENELISVNNNLDKTLLFLDYIFDLFSSLGLPIPNNIEKVQIVSNNNMDINLYITSKTGNYSLIFSKHYDYFKKVESNFRKEISKFLGKEIITETSYESNFLFLLNNNHVK